MYAFVHCACPSVPAESCTSGSDLSSSRSPRPYRSAITLQFRFYHFFRRGQRASDQQWSQDVPFRITTTANAFNTVTSNVSVWQMFWCLSPHRPVNGTWSLLCSGPKCAFRWANWPTVFTGKLANRLKPNPLLSPSPWLFLAGALAAATTFPNATRTSSRFRRSRLLSGLIAFPHRGCCLPVVLLLQCRFRVFLACPIYFLSVFPSAPCSTHALLFFSSVFR